MTPSIGTAIQHGPRQAARLVLLLVAGVSLLVACDPRRALSEAISAPLAEQLHSA
jgi:hypothetical protein